MPRVSWLCKVSDQEWLRAFHKLNPTDIDEGWLSVTIKKVIEHMGDQLNCLEAAKEDRKIAPNRAERAETIGLVLKLQKSTVELIKMEEKRDARLAIKHKGRNSGEIRDGLQRKILRNAAAGATRGKTRKSDG